VPDEGAIPRAARIGLPRALTGEHFHLPCSRCDAAGSAAIASSAATKTAMVIQTSPGGAPTAARARVGSADSRDLEKKHGGDARDRHLRACPW